MPDSSHDTAPAVAQRVNAGRSRSGFGCRELDGRSTLRGSISRALYAVPGTGPLATGPTRLGPGQRPVAGVESVAVSACANRELMTEFRRKVAPRRSERARIASPIGILAPHRAG